MNRKVVIAVLVSVGFVAAGFGLKTSLDRIGTPTPSAAVPHPDLSGVEPRVETTISDARDWVFRFPSAAEHWGRLAMVLHVHGFADEAVPAYRQASEFAASEFRWPYYEAIAAVEAGTGGEIDAFERAARISDSYPHLYLRLGKAQVDSGRMDEARAAYERALAINPALADAHVGLARIDLAGDALDASRDHLLSALSIEPGYSVAHGLLAEVYRRLGDETSAEVEQVRAIGSGAVRQTGDTLYLELIGWGHSARWYQVRGQALLDGGQPGPAEAQFRVALETRPEDANLHNDLGRALQRQGRLEEAAAEHAIAIELRPDFKEAMINLAGVLFQTGDVEGAVREANRAVELDPAFVGGWRTLGIIYAAAQRPDLAIQAFGNGLAAGEFDRETAARLAWLLATARDASLRDGPTAVQLAEAVGRLGDFRVPEELDLLAAAYAEAGRMDEATVFAAQAAQYAREDGRPELIPGIEARLAAYQSGRPWRE